MYSPPPSSLPPPPGPPLTVTLSTVSTGARLVTLASAAGREARGEAQAVPMQLGHRPRRGGRGGEGGGGLAAEVGEG